MIKVPAEKIQELVNGTKPPAIIHGLSEAKNTLLEMEARFIESLVGSTTSNNIIFEINKKKKKGGTKLFNLLNADKDFENCNGWSTAVTLKKMPALRGTNIGLFMVNLTEVSEMLLLIDGELFFTRGVLVYLGYYRATFAHLGQIDLKHPSFG